MKGFPLAFSKRNFAFLGICLGVLALIILVSILPLMAKIKLLEDEIPQVKAKIAEQSELAEIIKTIDQKLIELNEMPTLPNISLTSIPLIETSSVIGEIERLAKEGNLRVITIEPIVPESSIQLKTVTFNARMQGKITDLRSFLFALLKVTYIDKIERLKIISNENILDMDLTFSVRLS